MKTKLLFLCTANVDRSPCAESLFEKSERYEARSAALSELAYRQVSRGDVEWADIIFVMDERDEEHKSTLLKKFPEVKNKDIRILDVSNEFCRYNPKLERLLRFKLEREGVL